MLKGRCLELVTEAAKLLDSNKMLRLDLQSGNLGVADSGRVAAHFYIQAESVATFNEMLSRTAEPNPTYYGAESGSDQHVEARLLVVVEQSLAELRGSGCIEMGSDDSDDILPTALGIASAQYYLTYRTPMQMQVGIREARKIITTSLQT